ncbi:hypothetical protein GM415_02190 [Pseudodesulfovibrio cashew]|uniref:SGNH/GDSL hydrolase family protein n=1 Tax=Pseudodesulfovibrio cashew TaxID=2678688 RepID=A0A6I6JMS3_9BACT|nr:hypothetical protein [Pseudodesulfovibrio cashew]QGY38994.1 hypothetical protein GM415_02190 [Pseudodesulfovibrio cashew]
MLKSRIPKFILWGDSYADGVQVDDSLRAANLFNASSQRLKAFTVANGGLSVADYYFAIPRYERLGNDIEGHVILLVGLEDVLPGHQVACHSRFLTAPLRLEESACLPSKLSLEYASLVSRFRLESLFELYRSLAKYRFRLTAMHAEERRPVPNLSKTELHRSWAFLVDSFKRQTAGFLVFVYVPIVPALERGRIVTVNPEEESKILFKRICQDSGVGFIDLSQAFKKAYAEGEHMPRGFFNAPPTGHLNADGQRLVAASLIEYFSGRTR